MTSNKEKGSGEKQYNIRKKGGKVLYTTWRSPLKVFEGKGTRTPGAQKGRKNEKRTWGRDLRFTIEASPRPEGGTEKNSFLQLKPKRSKKEEGGKNGRETRKAR